MEGSIAKKDEENKLIPMYREIFFIENGSQSNIYCSTKLRYPSTTQERFLVGTLKGKVSCLERCDIVGAKEKFHSSHDMQAREVYFSYIPGDAELISIDAFYQHHMVRDSKCLIVGVTLILLKPENNLSEPKHFFNIYNALEPGTEFDLDKLAQSCQHQSLNFIPYHLQHGNIYVDGCLETCFLLSGSDQRIHLFRGDNQQKFEEHPCEEYFPEFSDIPGRVFWMDVKNCESFMRISAFGCDNGYLRVSLVDVKKAEVLSLHTMSLEGPITSVRLFTLKTQREYEVSNENGKIDSPQHLYLKSEDMNLLVTSALDVSVVFLNVAEHGLNNLLLLNQSDQFDSVTCSCVTDVDCDGQNEIILGTYGQELLVYKWYAPTNGVTQLAHFDLSWRREFSKPLLAIDCLDLMGDGMHELVVVSLTGVHILQHETIEAAETLLEKLVKMFPKPKTNEKKVNEHVTTEKLQNLSINDKSTEEKKSSTPMPDNGNELEDIIDVLCSTNNNYNEITTSET